MNGLKRFLCSSIGKVLLIIILYCTIFGCLSIVASIEGTEIIGGIVAIICAVFGWKALDKIQPRIFLFMPIIGWVIYVAVKGTLSVFIGLFVAPFIISKKLTEIIQSNITIEDDNYVHVKKDDARQVFYAEDVIREMSDKELEETYMDLMYILMPASSKSSDEPIPTDIDAYGCETWGEARELVDIIADIKNERLRKQKAKSSNKYQNLINQKSYQELEKAHSILTPIAVSCIPFTMDGASPEEVRKKELELENRKLPEDKRIWGCITYGDAVLMNEAIVKRLDELDRYN